MVITIIILFFIFGLLFLLLNLVFPFIVLFDIISRQDFSTTKKFLWALICFLSFNVGSYIYASFLASKKWIRVTGFVNLSLFLVIVVGLALLLPVLKKELIKDLSDIDAQVYYTVKNSDFTNDQKNRLRTEISKLKIDVQNMSVFSSNFSNAVSLVRELKRIVSDNVISPAEIHTWNLLLRSYGYADHETFEKQSAEIKNIDNKPTDPVKPIDGWNRVLCKGKLTDGYSPDVLKIKKQLSSQWGAVKIVSHATTWDEYKKHLIEKSSLIDLVFVENIFVLSGLITILGDGQEKTSDPLPINESSLKILAEELANLCAKNKPLIENEIRCEKYKSYQSDVNSFLNDLRTKIKNLDCAKN